MGKDWGCTFHFFDLDGREIALRKKEAIELARSIRKVVKEVEKCQVRKVLREHMSL